MIRSHLTALGIACASLLLAGCQMNVITEIDSSGAGMLTTEVGMTPEEVAQLQSLGGEAGDGACSAFSSGEMGAADAPAFVEEIRGEDTWCIAATKFESLDELATLYEDMDFVTIRELTLREGMLVYDLEVDTQGSGEAMTPADITWVLDLSGKPGSNNADRVEGKRLTWTLEPGEVTELQASCDLLAVSLPFDLGGAQTWIIVALACLCCGGVLVVVVVAVVLLLGRKRSEPAQSGASGQPSSAI